MRVKDLGLTTLNVWFGDRTEKSGHKDEAAFAFLLRGSQRFP